MTGAVLLVLAGAGFIACGQSESPNPDGGPEDAEVRFDAGTDAASSDTCSPGATRPVDCGNCGLASQVCNSGGVWDPPGPCMDEGECAPGATEMEATPQCGERSRICDATCAWRAWTIVRPDGECAPGTTRTGAACASPGEAHRETCSDTCTWNDDGCVDVCGGARRTAPDDASEVCVPAGSFWRGEDGFFNAEPAREVEVSAFYLDTFPVTNERYRACVAAGACTLITNPAGARSSSDLSRARYPVQGVSRPQAEAFCAWDGGRRLPTEAMWEKAARGPAPRMQPYAWDGPTFRCDRLQSGMCAFVWTSDQLPDEVDDQPGTRTYYGAELMSGGGYEWVSDTWSTTYYADPASLTDPEGPGGPGFGVTRGAPREFDEDRFFNVAYRRQETPLRDVSPDRTTFRCARPAP